MAQHNIFVPQVFCEIGSCDDVAILSPAIPNLDEMCRNVLVNDWNVLLVAVVHQQEKVQVQISEVYVPRVRACPQAFQRQKSSWYYYDELTFSEQFFENWNI